MKLSKTAIILIALIGLVLLVVYIVEQRANMAGYRAMKEMNKKNEKQKQVSCDIVYDDFYNNLLDVTQSHEPLKLDVYRCFNENPDGLAKVLLKTDGASGEVAAWFLYELSKTYQNGTLDLIASIQDKEHKEKLNRMLAYEYVYRCDLTMLTLIEQDGTDVHPEAAEIWRTMSIDFTKETMDCLTLLVRSIAPEEEKSE